MNQLILFSGGLELANLIVTSELLQRSWKEISEIHKQNQIHTNDLTPPSVSYKVFENRPNGTIIAFASSNHDTVDRDLVSSEELKGVFDFFGFVAANVNRSFSVHKQAVTVFSSLLNELTLLKAQYCNSNPLIITGHSLGGSIASLFTLWLLDNMSPNVKRPLCITFGSPLLGDKSFQQAILERPTWNSSFLHVVSNRDLFPQLFIAPCDVVSDGFTSQTRLYKPFGTFLLCTETGCACFEEPESTLELLKAMGRSQNSQNSLRFTDYWVILENLKHKSICRGNSQLDGSVMDPLLAGITMQLTTIGVETQGDGGVLNSLTTNTAARAKNFLIRKRNAYDPNKKLNERKVDMAYLEWYKKVAEDEGGYYDSYKNGQSGSSDEIRSREVILKRHRILTQYWKRMVAEVKKMPQKAGVSFRNRWLYAGTNYRRMVEPLDIADYYKKGHRDYITQGRSEHYILLEQWFNEDKLLGNAIERNRACSLTEDSCFWANVEEAVIWCDILKDGQSRPEGRRSSKEKLIRFEGYMMDMIKNYAVSPEIFLPRSSFMKWWEMYSIIARESVGSPFIDFMNKDYSNYA